MNRIKKEFRIRGYRLENECGPLPTDGGVQAIIIDSEQVTYTIVHTSIIVKYKMLRNGEVVDSEWM